MTYNCSNSEFPNNRELLASNNNYKTLANDLDFFYNISKNMNSNIKRSYTNMSIVGFVRCRGGIITISDSKSTLNYESEPGRENIDKMFYFSNLIVTNFGLNRICGEPIEKILLNSEFNSCTDVFSFVSILKRNCPFFYIEEVKNINFIIYEYKTRDIFFVTVSNDFSHVDIQLANDKMPFALGGNEYYINVVKETIDRHKTYDIDRLSEVIKTTLESTVKTLDQGPCNNPCGLPIKTKVIKF